MKWQKSLFISFSLSIFTVLIIANCSGGGSIQGNEEDNILALNKWQQLGHCVNPEGINSEDPTMLIVNNIPSVGYRHTTSKTYLNLWDGNSWGTSEPDPTNNMTNFSIYNTPDFYSDGNNIFMAYSHIGDSRAHDNSYYEHIFLYKWNSTSKWTILNNGDELSNAYYKINSGGSALEPTLASGSNGYLFVAWVETEVISKNNDDVCVAEISNMSINRSESLNRNKNIGSYTTDVRTVGITVDSLNNAYIAHWEQNDLYQERCDLYVTKYNRGSFFDLGDIIDNDYDAGNLSVPSLTVNKKNLYVAYTVANNNDYTRHVYVKKYDGTWSTLGNGPVSAFSPNDHDDSANPDLLFVNNTLYIAWEESSKIEGYFIYVAYWDNKDKKWVIDADKLNIDTVNSAHDPSLAYSHHDGSLYVAFEEIINEHSHIFVKRKKVSFIDRLDYSKLLLRKIHR